MKLPTLDTQSEAAPALEELLAESERREPEALSTRERWTEGGLLVLLVGACALVAAVFDQAKLDIGPSIALVIAYAIASRVRFYVGAGYTVPTQLVLIPMLFELPAATVPLAVALAFVLGRLPDTVRGDSHPDRLLLAATNAWHAIGPAIVFAAAGLGAASWSDGGWYVAAFAAQIATDFVISTLRIWIGLGVPPTLQVAVLTRIYMVDALLTPIGLMAAFAANGSPYRALLVLPLIGLISVFAQEREANIQTALQLSSAYRGTALLLGDVLEDKDAYTASHSHGVVSLSLMVADKLKLDPAARRRVEFGALLHDIGKIAVPAEIINKPGPLDAEEWAVMKLHTVEGQQMLDRVGGVLGEVGRVVRSSHEHFDGSGYPDGLTGDGIPIEARVVCCCDAFSAMTTTRSYRTAMTLEAARAELVANAGTQFDPLVVSALLEVIAEQKISVHVPGALEELPHAPPAHQASAQAP